MAPIWVPDVFPKNQPLKTNHLLCLFSSCNTLFCLLNYVVADAVVSVIFEDDNDGKIYSIQWAELLGSDELPIEEFSAIKPGMDVIAPWTTGDGSPVQYAPAIVCEGDVGMLIYVLF